MTPPITMGFLATSFLLWITFSGSVRAGQMIKAAPGATDVVPDSYIVVMNSGMSNSDFESHKTWVTGMSKKAIRRRRGAAFSGMGRTWDSNEWKGYSGSFDRQTIQNIVDNPSVSYVEPDRFMNITAFVTQTNAPSYGLGRISNKQPGIRDYIFDESAGRGITIYGVDTGIDVQSPEFGGRAVWGTNEINDINQDEHGHGTHTAGTFAGVNFGVAKRANIVAVKVLDAQGSGRTSGIISGVNWCVQHARENNLLGRAVMNLSLGGTGARAFNDVATNAVRAGIFLSVAAGNDGVDAINTSPANARGVCTVGASTEQDTRASFSNFGRLVDVFAPGDKIPSVFPGNRQMVLSGTSMATPHVSGVAAYLMALEGIRSDQVCARIRRLAQPRIQNAGANTTNRLLYNNSGVGSMFYGLCMLLSNSDARSVFPLC